MHKVPLSNELNDLDVSAKKTYVRSLGSAAFMVDDGASAFLDCCLIKKRRLTSNMITKKR